VEWKILRLSFWIQRTLLGLDPLESAAQNCRRAPPPTLIAGRVWASAGVRPKPAATAAAARLRLISIHFPAATRPGAQSQNLLLLRRPIAACTSRASREPPWRAKLICTGTAMPRLRHNTSVAAGLASAMQSSTPTYPRNSRGGAARLPRIGGRRKFQPCIPERCSVRRAAWLASAMGR